MSQLKVCLSFLCLLTVMFLVGCKETRSWTADDLIIDEDTHLSGKQLLTNDEVQDDVSYLAFALEGYGGRDYHPPGEFQQVVSELEAIEGELSAVELRDEIDGTLLRLVDNHLKATLDEQVSAKRRATYRPAEVGNNAAINPDKGWEVRKLDNKLYISITRFYLSNDPIWEGFLEAAKREMPSSLETIIDLRGNGGGDDQKGRELAALFYGAKPAGLFSAIESKSLITQAIFANIFGYFALKLRSSNQVIPDHLNVSHQFALSNYQSAKDGGNTSSVVHPITEGTKEILPSGYRRPIYILMDSKCGSSCESTIDYFEWHTHVKKVGQNTAGYVHFGNSGSVLLPHSKIRVSIATKYNKYFDGRNVERTGISPDIRVPAGTDALEYTLNHL